MSTIDQILVLALFALVVTLGFATIDRAGCAFGASELWLACEVRP